MSEKALSIRAVVGAPPRLMQYILEKWRKALLRPHFFHSVLLALVLFYFAISFMLNCARYAETYPYTPRIHDFLLNLLPVVDMNAFATFGIELFIWTFYLMTLIFFPERFAFVIKTFAVFKIARGLALVMTHLGPPLCMLEDGYPGSTFGGMFFTKDLFFSGHTGYPILAAVLFWDIPWMRWIGLTVGLMLGFSTLLMHDHYTIDVFGAIVTTPVAYFISRWLFTTDYLAGVDPYRPVVRQVE
ncbi:MAG: hypothetical protein J7M25_00260 [Deltaproteobacteria bacterium]|nr:hypothetical protein [Deltaproteobacteria bacterium]